MLFVEVLDNQLSTLLQNAATVFGVELHAIFELVANGFSKIGLRKGDDRNEHVLKFKITVIALNGLVEQGPNLQAVLLGKLSVFAEKTKGGKTKRARILIKAPSAPGRALSQESESRERK